MRDVKYINCDVKYKSRNSGADKRHARMLQEATGIKCCPVSVSGVSTSGPVLERRTFWVLGRSGTRSPELCVPSCWWTLGSPHGPALWTSLLYWDLMLLPSMARACPNPLGASTLSSPALTPRPGSLGRVPYPPWCPWTASTGEAVCSCRIVPWKSRSQGGEVVRGKSRTETARGS